VVVQVGDDSLFHEQYLDAVAAIINAQETAGLDIVTDGDSRFDLAEGGKSWFFYPIERLGGVHGHRDTSRGQEAHQPSIVTEKRREHGLPEARVRAADPRLYFANVGEGG
jgi:methionine synthase II (cobalamin-independent)